MASADTAINGGFYQPEAQGLARYEYPFRKNGDRWSGLFEQEYWQRISTYVPAELKSPHETQRDHYLVAESEPSDVLPGAGVYRFVRTYARVPLTQTVPGSLWVTKPELTGTFPQVINGSLVTQPDETKEEYAFSTRVAVTSDSGAPSSAISGGTFTVTFGANTTAGQAWNVAAGTLQTAINGLASVIAYGSVVVTGSHTAGFTITWATYAASTCNIASLTATDAYAFVSSAITGGMSQRITITPVWNDGAYSVDSTSITPVGAQPLLTTNVGPFKIYSYNVAGTQAAGGTFTITAYGQTTAAIAWNATLAQITTALNLLSEFNPDRGGAYVAGTPLSTHIGAFTVAPLGLAALTGGTFTLTVLGQTTGTIAYNASIATISTAVNLLSNVTARGGVIIGGAGFASGKQDFTITFANIPAMTGSAASLTPSGSSLYFNTVTGQGTVNTLNFALSTSSLRILTAPVHGIAAADNIYVNSTLVTAGGFAVIDANTISLNSLSGMVSSATAITFIGKVMGVNYVAGPKETRCDYVTDFYLPGITAGISTAVDIPIPDYHGDDEALIEAIFAGSTEININTGQLAQWRDTPILARTITKINAALL